MKKITLIILSTFILALLISCSKQSDDYLLETIDDEYPETISQETEGLDEDTVIEEKEPIYESDTSDQIEKEELENLEEIEEIEEPMPEQDLLESSEEYIKEETIEEEQERTGLLSQFVEKANRIKNFQYRFGEPPFVTKFDYYSIQLRNDKNEKEFLIRVDLYPYDPPKLEDYWDTVFLNPEKKEAKIYCLNPSNCQSKNIDKTKQTEIVEYEDYIKLTPYDWLLKIPNQAKVIGNELLDKKTVTKFQFTANDGNIYTFWLDVVYGLPLQIEVVSPEDIKVRYSFKDMTINAEKSKDFIPPF
jgi:hypothetical protein